MGVSGNKSIMFLYITMLSSRHIVGKTVVKGSKLPPGEEFRFEALQCNEARALSRYSGRNFCDTNKIKEENGLMQKQEGSVYTVLQYNEKRVFNAIQCEKKVSTLSIICGAFSHSKIIEAPDVLKSTRIPRQECSDIADTNLVTTEDGRQLKALVGTRLTYKFVEAGAVTLSAHNVACEGGEMKIAGKKHDNVVRLITVEFRIIEVGILEDKGRLKSRNDGWLPRACSVANEGCSLEDFTLVINPSKVPQCMYAEVRKAVFKSASTEGRSLLVNDEHKMLFQISGKAPSPTNCPWSAKLIKTNFDNLFLVAGELTVTNKVEAELVDMELESRVADLYMEYWSLNLAKETASAWQAEACNLAASRLNEEQLVLHGDHLMRMRGEIVSEFQCERVTVTARSGFKAENERCLDHLPVFTAKLELMYLAPLTRILMPRSAVSVVNCSINFPISIEDLQGRMVSANPGVAIVEVALSEYHLRNADQNNHTEMFEVKSLLYTPEEITEYEQIILGPDSERAVTKQFSSYYCQTTGECSPSRETQDFKWERMLKNPGEILDWWWEELKDWALWWGAVWGCIDSALTLIVFFLKLATVCCHMSRTDMDKKTLVKFVFMPGQELVNLFPTKVKPRAASGSRRGRQSAMLEPEEDGVAGTELRTYRW